MSSTNDTLADVLQQHRHWLVLTGAGCSTKAGLGDYRDKQGEWKRQQPITGQLFRDNELARKRYWARGFVGWRNFSSATPTQTHIALTELQHQIHAPTLITQNVDQLHQRAHHTNVIDLHGVLAEVICLDCGHLSSRSDMQDRLSAANPWLHDLDASYAPDGDADLTDVITDTLAVPDCELCQGLLKPNVVFFGENVPRSRVDSCFEALNAADALLIVGSSLMVYSGFRFCRRAHEQNKTIVIVNDGVTRADELASHKFSGECGESLTRALQQLNPAAV